MSTNSERDKGGEMLSGAQKIAVFMGVSPRQIYYWVEVARLPVFRVGKTLCARPARLREWISEREAEAIAGGDATARADGALQ